MAYHGQYFGTAAIGYNPYATYPQASRQPTTKKKTSQYSSRQIGGLQSAGSSLTSATSAANQMAGIAARPPEYYVGQAGVDVGLAYDEALAASKRDLSRMGINPNTGRYAGMEADWGLARSAAEVGAMTRARQQAEREQFGELGTVSQTYAGLAPRYTGLAGEYGQLAEEEALAGYEGGISPYGQEGGYGGGWSTSTRGSTGGSRGYIPLTPAPAPRPTGYSGFYVPYESSGTTPGATRRSTMQRTVYPATNMDLFLGL